MTTTNPKVSAYIPQHIFDRFQSFFQDKGISMSQAVAVIFAEYFEIEPEVNYSGGLLTDRLLALESKVFSLGSLHSDLLGGLLSRIEKLESEKGNIEFSSGSKSEPLEVESTSIEKDPPQQLTAFDISGDGFTHDSIAKELSGQELSQLLGISASKLSTKKRDLKSSEDFTAWTKSLEGNSSKIGWGYREKAKGEGKGVLYYPVSEPLA